MRKVKQSEIIETFTACPYCCNPKSESWHECCGEVHSELAYELQDGETLLESELQIVKGA